MGPVAQEQEFKKFTAYMYKQTVEGRQKKWSEKMTWALRLVVSKEFNKNYIAKIS